MLGLPLIDESIGGVSFTLFSTFHYYEEDPMWLYRPQIAVFILLFFNLIASARAGDYFASLKGGTTDVIVEGQNIDSGRVFGFSIGLLLNEKSTLSFSITEEMGGPANFKGSTIFDGQNFGTITIYELVPYTFDYTWYFAGAQVNSSICRALLVSLVFTVSRVLPARTNLVQ